MIDSAISTERVSSQQKFTELGDICSLLTDGSHSSPKPVVSEHYMASVKDMRYNHFDFSECKTISKEDFDDLVRAGCSPERGDILISKDGANCLDLIFVYKQDRRIVLLSSIAIARLKDGFSPDFYRYYLLSPGAQEIMRNGFVSGSAIPRVVLKDFKRVPVPVVPHSEQLAIASILSSLDDKIDLLHRQNKTLEELAQTIFRQWFVEGAEEGWGIGSISTIVNIQSGYAFKSIEFTERGMYRLVTIKNVQHGDLDVRNTVGIDNIPHRMPDYCRLSKGDILLSLTGNVGRCCLVDQEGLLLNQRVAKLHPIRKLDWAFVYCMFRSDSTRIMLEERAKGTAQANLSPVETGEMEILIPPISVMDKFAEATTSLLLKVLSNRTQISTLTQLRDTLLPKLMSGDVNVTILD